MYILQSEKCGCAKLYRKNDDNDDRYSWSIVAIRELMNEESDNDTLEWHISPQGFYYTMKITDRLRECLKRAAKAKRSIAPKRLLYQRSNTIFGKVKDQDSAITMLHFARKEEDTETIVTSVPHLEKIIKKHQGVCPMTLPILE